MTSKSAVGSNPTGGLTNQRIGLLQQRWPTQSNWEQKELVMLKKPLKNRLVRIVIIALTLIVLGVIAMSYINTERVLTTGVIFGILMILQLALIFKDLQGSKNKSVILGLILMMIYTSFFIILTDMGKKMYAHDNLVKSRQKIHLSQQVSPPATAPSTNTPK